MRIPEKRSPFIFFMLGMLATVALVVTLAAGDVQSDVFGLIFKEVISGDTPDSGYVNVYAKTDGKIYSKDAIGTEYDLTAGASSGDMLKTTYDPNSDGKIANAQLTSGSDIASAISLKHDGTTQDTAIANKTTLTDVKADVDVADAISKKHSSSLDHTQNTDTGTSATSFVINGSNAIREGDSRLTDARTPLAHNQDANTITSGTIDGDILPAFSQTKKAGVPATGVPSGKYLKDDGTWDAPAGGSGDMTKAVYDPDLDSKIAEAQLSLNYATHSNLLDHSNSQDHSHSNKTTLDNITEAFTTALKASYDAAVTASHSHSNMSILNSITEAFTTTLKTAYDSAVTASHTQQHSITSTSDHTSTATLGQMLKADANGLPINATNTDTQVSGAVTNSHTHSNKSVLDATQESFTTALKTSYDWLVTNITSVWKTSVDSHMGSTSNPHSVTKAQVGLTSVTDNAQIALSLVDAKGDLVTATADNTPARLASSGVNNQVLMIDTTTATGLKWATPAGGGESEQTVILTADRTNTTTSFADITDLTFTPLANKTYVFEAWLILQSNTALTGIKFAGNGPASPTAYVMNAHIPIALTLYASDSNMASRAYDTGTPSVSVDTINSNLLAKIDGVLVNGSNSTAFTLRFAAETTGIVKVKAGSVLRYRQVN